MRCRLLPLESMNCISTGQKDTARKRYQFSNTELNLTTGVYNLPWDQQRCWDFRCPHSQADCRWWTRWHHPWGCGRHCPRSRCRKLPATQHTAGPRSPSWGPGTLRLKGRRQDTVSTPLSALGFPLSPKLWTFILWPRWGSKFIRWPEWNLSPFHLTLSICVCLSKYFYHHDVVDMNWEEAQPGHLQGEGADTCFLTKHLRECMKGMWCGQCGGR